MDLFEIIKKNAKLYMILSIVVLLGTIGVTYSLVISKFEAIGINTTTAEINANITYETNGNGAEIINTGNMLPIKDEEVTGPDVTNTRVLKVKFNVSGHSGNPENTIYDIALRDIDIDCELRTKDLKWRLYKNGTKLSEGNLSPAFDTMANNRLVLTDTQEDLTTNVDKYTFLLWISETCTGDIANCDSSMAQNKYLNRTLKATIKVELATQNKKPLERITASSESCTYTPIEVPLCNNLTYTGSVQTLINNGDNYNLINSSGTNAGSYAITAKLKDGYKWSNGSTADKVINCSIKEKNISVTTLDQTIMYGNKITSTVNDVATDGLLNGNTLNAVTLNSSIADVGTGTISINNVKIVDDAGKDVTNNYKVDKRNTGKITITCLNIAEEPIISDKGYNGNEQTGITGGEYITISGKQSAKEVGSYKVVAVPNKNYCWSDNSTTPKEYTWNILTNKYSININLEDKSTTYTGNSISIDDAIITDSDGTELTDVPLTYNYYNGSSCSGTVMSEKPVNAGNYSVKAYSSNYNGYTSLESNCAKLTVSKAAGSITASTENLSLTHPTTGTFTYEYTGDGNISCSSSSTSTATCTIDTSNKKVTVTPVGAGNGVITLTLAAGTNYTGATDTVSVNVSYTALTITLNNQSANNAGTSTLYGRYSDGIYLDSGYSKKMSTSSNAITVPTKTGYTFGGYYTSTNGQGTQLISASGYLTSSFTTTLYNNNVTLYAKWTPNTYIVVYHANGGSGTMANSEHTSGTQQALSKNTFTRTGYTFKGWATSSSGSASYSDEQKITYYSSTNGKKINLYAVWKDDTAPSVPTYTAVYADGSGNYTSGNYANKEVRTTITSIDSGSGVSYMEYSSDKSSWTRLTFNASNGISNSNGTYSGIENWTPEDNRTGTYYFRACDANGNCSNASEAYSIKFDTTLPTMGDVEVASNIFGAISAYNMARSVETITTYSNDSFHTLGGINITNVTKVIITHSSPVTVADTYKVYYATSGEEFDEENFVEQAVSVGDTVVKIDMPGGDYTALKFASDSGNGGEVIDIVGDGVSTDNYIHTTVGDTTSGITAYAITNSNVEPTSWIDITNSSSYDIRAEISNNTSTYIWVKDAAGNITSKNFKLAVANYYYYDKVYAQTSTTANCIIDSDSSTCNFKIPSFVTSSTGPDNATYYGVSTSPSSSTVTTTYNSTNLNYYAVYKGSWTATYEKGSGVATIGSTSNSCTNYKRTNGSSYSSTSCTVTLPTITSNDGNVLGWYNSSDTKVGNAGASLTLSANGKYTAKAELLLASDFTYDNSNTGVDCSDVSCMIDELYEFTFESDLSLGDYVSYTPTVTSFKTDTSKTNYTSTQTIYPSELNLWRVLNINDDGTVDLISEYVSSTSVSFKGQLGYQNFVGYLNELAEQYETEGITSGSRHFGYNGQTKYITDTSMFTNPAPWTCSTGRTCNPVESQGGGDTLYEKDYNQLITALGTRVAKKVGTETATIYWMASRDYSYSTSSIYGWYGRYVNASGSSGGSNLYHYIGSSVYSNSSSNALRPIVTLKSELTYVGEGTADSPRQIITN